MKTVHGEQRVYLEHGDDEPSARVYAGPTRLCDESGHVQTFPASVVPALLGSGWREHGKVDGGADCPCP